MATRTPSSLSIRTYDVGFGDCFLLTFHYGQRDRHILVDFGSMRLPTGKTMKGDYMVKVAEAIKGDCGGKLDVVVATHRHQDHVSGFDRRNGKGPGVVIRSLKPDLVIQPWTEDPRAAIDAMEPTQRSFARTLREMQSVAKEVVSAADGLQGERFRRIRTELATIGMDNIKNADAVENLRTMAPNRYVFHGSDAGMGRILPGVNVTVLGPPTVKQSSTIKTQRSTDADEFWHLTSRFWQRLAATQQAHTPKSKKLFPRFPLGRLPRSAGWLKFNMMQEQSESLMSIVRMLDKAMNNTSVILLFEVKNKLVLFPGDAQYENWMYALGKPDIRRKLKNVDVYKVGHHGSLNATPKSLWNGFSRRSTKQQHGRLQTLLSTKRGVHGHVERKTEVPRTSLFNALRKNSTLTNTAAFRADELSETVTVAF